MYDIQKMSIWKEQPAQEVSAEYIARDIAELGLSVRSYNCLKRAGCSTVGDVLAVMESEKSLLSIRNLGKTSATEIKEKLEEYRSEAEKNMHNGNSGCHKKTLIKPARKYWDCEISEFCLSNHARQSLKQSGIRYVRDLYAPSTDREPGWFAVRELFEKIPV